MRLGQAAMEALRAEVHGRLIPDEELIVVGDIARSGTEVLVREKEAYLASFFSDAFLHSSVGHLAVPDQTVVWKLAEKYGADALYEAGEGGILAALWKLAEASQVGLRVDLRRIPVRQETIEICERLDVNPYQLHAKGCLVTGMKNGTAFVMECRRLGYPAAIIGETNHENARLLYSGENARYLERPQPDEIYRFRKEGERNGKI